MTVLVLSILVLLAYSFSYSAGLSRRAAINARNALRRSCGEESALNYALAMLRRDAEDDEMDTVDDDWAQSDISCRVGEEEYFITIIDEDRKVNVNRAVQPPADPEKDFDLRVALKRLIRAVGGDDGDFEALADWIGPGNPLPLIEGLRAVSGLDARLLEAQPDKPALDSLLATHTLHININTAPGEVLDALWDNSELTRQVIARQEREPFRSQADIHAFLNSVESSAAVRGSASLLDVRSEFFVVRVSGAAVGPYGSLAALVKRAADGVQILNLRRVVEERSP